MRFISVTKPGIIFGNAVTLCGGYFLGAQNHPHLWVFLTTLVGMSLVIASGCVLNNLIDRDIDCLMERTKERVLVKGLISAPIAGVYASILAVLGLLLLYFFANPLTAFIALFGLFFYVVVYSLYLKRSRFGTEVGAVAGAMPPVVGFCAATNTFNLGALSLFLILFFWQMPHSYSIAIYRLRDYAVADIPVLPLRKNIKATKLSMFIYVLIFMLMTMLPCLLGYTGKVYLLIALCLGLVWLLLAGRGFLVKDDRRWARRMFGLSILNIMLLSISLSLG